MWDQYCHLVVWLPIEAGYCKTKESGKTFCCCPTAKRRSGQAEEASPGWMSKGSFEPHNFFGLYYIGATDNGVC